MSAAAPKAVPQQAGRQERNTDKEPLTVYVPAELRQYLKERSAESGLSESAYMVLLLRRDKRST